MSENILELKNLNKSYGEQKVLDNLSLNIKKNEFLTLLGPSGCGKTTTLKIIAGFENADSGELIFKNNDISTLPPYKRKVNTVFQKYALFPHMNIFDNIAFGLKLKKLPKDEIKNKVEEMLSLVALKGFEKRSVDSLSGGQQQRVAIARALINKPEILLLDEPLGALDLKLRKEMQIELKKIQQEVGITFVFVTHDQEEALTMSDTIIVMNKGIIQQMGTPQDIYNEPANAFVADFIGESNILNGTMIDNFKVEFCNKTFECVDEGFEKMEPIDVVITVTSQIFKGVHYEMIVSTEEFDFILHNTKCAEVGSIIGLDIYPEDIHIMRKSGQNE